MGASNDSLIGTTIDGRYEVEGPLGEGAMGVVYRARHLRLERPAALKVLHDKHGRNPVLVKRFLREARAASQVSHPNVVPIYDYGQLDSGQPYMAMELREVPTLADHIESDGPFEPARALALVAALADALSCVHASGIIHRDLKPENIALGPRDHVTVLDFGIAKVAGGGRLTSTGEVVGTPLYMSPEQCRGDPIDPRSDVYALGAILYEMLTKRPPFEGTNIVAIVSAHLMDEPPDARALVSTIPPRVAALATRCLAKDREARPASMRALHEEASALLSEGDAKTLYAATPPAAARLHPQTRPHALVEVTEPLPTVPRGGLPALRVPVPATRGGVGPADVTPPPASGPALTPHEVQVPEPERRAPRVGGETVRLPIGRGRLLVGGLSILAAVAALGVGVLLSRQPAAVPEPPPRAVASPEPAAPAVQASTAVGAVSEAVEEARSVRVESEPSGAEVADATGVLGVTPLSLEVSGPRDLTLRLEGYEPAVLALGPGSADEPMVRLVPSAPAEPAPPTSRGRARRARRPEAHPTNREVVDPWGR